MPGLPRLPAADGRAAEHHLGLGVRLTIRVLGVELLHLDLDTDSPSPEPERGADCTTYPVGFAASAGDQRWAEHKTPDLD